MTERLPDISPSKIAVDDTPIAFKSARARTRALLVQGLYAIEINKNSPMMVRLDIESGEDFRRADKDFFREAWEALIPARPDLEMLFVNELDRPLAETSPIERAILTLATWELRDRIDVPFKVVINEAVELTKHYGGTDGHKYVNGVLDKVAPNLRAVEWAHLKKRG
jgi:transcription antitermination protein NusB